MTKVLRNIALSLVLFLFVFWLVVQTSSFQAFGKQKIEQIIAQNSDFEVSIGNLSGFLPFSLNAEKIRVVKKSFENTPAQKICTIESISLVPLWFDLIFGNISFLSLQIDTPIIEKTFISSQNSDATPAQSELQIPKIPFDINLYSFEINHLQLSDSENSNQKLSIDVSGKIYWKEKKSSLAGKIQLVPHIASEFKGLLALDFKINKNILKGSLSVEMQKGFNNQTLEVIPFKTITTCLDFSGSSSAIFSYLSQASKQQESLIPLLVGNFRSWAVPDEKFSEQYPALYGLSTAGSIQLDTKRLSFSTDEIVGHVIPTQPIDDEVGPDEKLFASSPPIDDHKSCRENRFPFPIKGSFKGHFSYAKTADELSLEFGLESSRLELQNLILTNLENKLRTSIKSGNIYGTLDSSVSLSETTNAFLPIPIAFKTSYQSDLTKTFQIKDLLLDIAHIPCKGTFSIDIPTRACLGFLKVEQERLEPFAKLFHTDLEAQTSLSLTVDPIHDQNNELTHKLHCIAQLEKVLGTDIAIEKATLELQGFVTVSQLDLNATCSVKNIYTPSAEIDALKCSSTLHFAEVMKPFPLSLELTGRSKAGALCLQTNGEYSLFAPLEPFFCLNKFFVSSGNASINNKEPLQISWNQKEIRLLPLTLISNNKGSISAEFLGTKEAVSGKFEALDIPLELLDPFFSNFVFSGYFSGLGDLWGTSELPRFVLKTTTKDFAWWDRSYQQFPPLASGCQIELENHQLHIFGELQGFETKKPFSWDVTVPVNLSFFPFAVAIQKNEPLNGSITGEAALDTLLSEYLDEDEIVEGKIALNFLIKGSCEEPHFEGDFFVKEGKVGILTTGTELSNIFMHARVEEDQIVIDTLKGTDDRKEGSLTGSGWVKLDVKENFPFEIDLALANLQVVQLDFANIVVKGSSKLAGNMKKILLSGNMEAEKAEINITSTIATDLPKLDIIWANQEDAWQPIKKETGEIGIDLEINLPKGIITGPFLKSEWTGKVQIVGSPENLLMKGKVSCEDGTIAFANKEFFITHGTVDFAGDLFSQSRLNVIATIDLPQIVAHVIVRGPLDAPRLVLQSTPAMDDKDIISWILFGKSSTEISAGEGLQLAGIIISMKGSCSDFDPLAKIKDTLGIDRIDISTGNQVGPPSSPGESADSASNTSNAARLQVGKFIYDGVLVNVSNDVADQVNRVGLEVNLSKNVTVQAEVGDDADAIVSLNWKHNY